MVTTRRTRASKKETTVEQAELVTNLSPRKTRSGRARILASSDSVTVPTENEKVTSKAKSVSTKKRSRKNKNIQAENIIEIVEEVKHSSPEKRIKVRTPLSEVSSVDSILSPRVCSPQKSPHKPNTPRTSPQKLQPATPKLWVYNEDPYETTNVADVSAHDLIGASRVSEVATDICRLSPSDSTNLTSPVDSKACVPEPDCGEAIEDVCVPVEDEVQHQDYIDGSPSRHVEKDASQDVHDLGTTPVIPDKSNDIVNIQGNNEELKDRINGVPANSGGRGDVVVEENSEQHEHHSILELHMPVEDETPSVTDATLETALSNPSVLHDPVDELPQALNGDEPEIAQELLRSISCEALKDIASKDDAFKDDNDVLCTPTVQQILALSTPEHFTAEISPARLSKLSPSKYMLQGYENPSSISDSIALDVCQTDMTIEPATPRTPSTTWIDGLEVPLPPDDWSPIASIKKISSQTSLVEDHSEHVTITDSAEILESADCQEQIQDQSGPLTMVLRQCLEQAEGDQDGSDQSGNVADAAIREAPTFCASESLSAPLEPAGIATSIGHFPSTLRPGSSPEAGLQGLMMDTLDTLDDTECAPTEEENISVLCVKQDGPTMLNDAESYDRPIETENVVPELEDDSFVEAFGCELGMDVLAAHKSTLPENTFFDKDVLCYSTTQVSTPASPAALAVPPESTSFMDDCNAEHDTSDRQNDSVGPFEDNFDIRNSIVQSINPQEFNIAMVSDSTNDELVLGEIAFVSGMVESEVAPTQVAKCDIAAVSASKARLDDRQSIELVDELSFIAPVSLVAKLDDASAQPSPSKAESTIHETHSVRGGEDYEPVVTNVSFVPAAEVVSAPPDDAEALSPVLLANDELLSLPLQELESKSETPVADMISSPAENRAKKSSHRRQSRRQSYLTATKSAVRERELEFQQRADALNAADLQLVVEMEASDSLLQEMPGSVERKRSKRRSNSTSRRSPLIHSLETRQTRSRTSVDAEAFSPIELAPVVSLPLHMDRSATKIQALFRGWRSRKQFALHASADTDLEDSTESFDNSEVPTTAHSQPQVQSSPVDVDDRPSSKSSDVNDVFTDFLNKWQTKKSLRAQNNEMTNDIAKAEPSSTPRRTEAGVLSPRKSDKKPLVLVAPVPSSAQKHRRPSSKSSRTRLPAPRISSLNDTNNAEVKSASSEDSHPSHDSPSSSPSRTTRKRKDVDDITIKEGQKRPRLAKHSSLPGPSMSSIARPITNRSKSTTAVTIPASRVLAPTTPKKLNYLTPAEVAKTTKNFTMQNRLYRCDFDRVVIRKEIPRPPSPTAKIQTKIAANARAKRRRAMKETGYVLGAGDEEDYSPKFITPSRKAVKWNDDLETNLFDLARTSPTKVRGIKDVQPCIAPATLDEFGNVENSTPLTPELGKAPKVLVTKYLYKGEVDD